MSETAAIDGARREWDSVSEAWVEHAEYVEPSVAGVTTRLLELLDARPGESILELGGGVGTFGATVADAAGPGGRVVVSDLAPGMVGAAERRLQESRGAGSLPWHSHLAGAPGGDPFAPGGLFSLANPGTVQELLSQAGFGEMHIEEVSSPHEFVDFESYWRSISRLAGPIALFLAESSIEKVNRVRGALREVVSRYATSEHLVLPGAALVVRAS